jgi:hypothetical protein
MTDYMLPNENYILEKILKTNSKGCIENLEDDAIEFKERLDWENPEAQKKYLKEIVALSNSGGGYLIFGVNDVTGEILGLNEITSVDLKLITDQLQKHFVPSIEISARTYEYEGKALFLIYAYEFKEVPAVCIREGHDLKNGSLYWRYSGKAEPIKGSDLHLLLSRLRAGSTSELVKFSKEIRKKDIMPKFEWNDFGTSSLREYKCHFKNIGAQGFVVDVISDKTSNAYIERICSSKRMIKAGEEWIIFGSYKGSFEPQNRTYMFRLYFQDEDDKICYQEYIGGGGSVLQKYVKPIETTTEDMEEYKQQNTI